MENNTEKVIEEVKEIQDERDMILEKGLNEAWERGFKYGVAWLLKKTVTEEDTERVANILEAFEEQEMLKGITPIYYSLEEHSEEER
jgi:hypothetical protein